VGADNYGDFSDGKWRAHDTASLRAVLGALQAAAATALECELTAEFGVDWVPRADGRGNEIRGVTQAQMDAFSLRTVQVHEKERELARAWQRRHGRAPTSRELPVWPRSQNVTVVPQPAWKPLSGQGRPWRSHHLPGASPSRKGHALHGHMRATPRPG